VLLTDLTYAAIQSSQVDDLHRVFYVGVTRTKDNLYLIDPEDFSRAYDV
jgi:ATP-dependent exoDNAse (exonuclease V) beta subunit